VLRLACSRQTPFRTLQKKFCNIQKSKSRLPSKDEDSDIDAVFSKNS
jgi:hypothetical protein